MQRVESLRIPVSVSKERFFEIAELYYSLFNPNDTADGYSHQHAVVEEFILADSLGLTGQYIQLAMIWAQDLSSPI